MEQTDRQFKQERRERERDDKRLITIPETRAFVGDNAMAFQASKPDTQLWGSTMFLESLVGRTGDPTLPAWFESLVQPVRLILE